VANIFQIDLRRASKVRSQKLGFGWKALAIQFRWCCEHPFHEIDFVSVRSCCQSVSLILSFTCLFRVLFGSKFWTLTF
jgi:hypothetical protein